MTAIAALVGINTGYLALAFLPPILYISNNNDYAVPVYGGFTLDLFSSPCFSS